MATSHSFTVTNIEAETRNVVTITFTIPSALHNGYASRPGQHLTLKVHSGREELRRCYSICRSHSPSEISITVKTTDGGCFSRHARQGIQQGMALEVMVPQGRFGYQLQAEYKAECLVIAAGSDITPMMAIIEATLATEPASQLTLIYDNRSSHGMMFRQALADLKDRYSQRLQVVRLFSQELMDSDLLQGCTDGNKLRALGKNLLDFSCFDDVFIYDPSVMIGEIEVALYGLGTAERSIHFERFNTPRTSMKCATGVQAEGCTVTLRQGGYDHLISLSAEDDSILDAVLRQGTDLPFACRGSVRTAYKCKVISGEVAIAINYSLETDELATGYVLNCQMLPTSGDVMVDFDARGTA